MLITFIFEHLFLAGLILVSIVFGLGWLIIRAIGNAIGKKPELYVNDRVMTMPSERKNQVADVSYGYKTQKVFYRSKDPKVSLIFLSVFGLIFLILAIVFRRDITVLAISIIVFLVTLKMIYGEYKKIRTK